jgi:hypothetical protein
MPRITIQDINDWSLGTATEEIRLAIEADLGAEDSRVREYLEWMGGEPGCSTPRLVQDHFDSMAPEMRAALDNLSFYDYIKTNGLSEMTEAIAGVENLATSPSRPQVTVQVAPRRRWRSGWRLVGLAATIVVMAGLWGYIAGLPRKGPLRQESIAVRTVDESYGNRMAAGGDGGKETVGQQFGSADLDGTENNPSLRADPAALKDLAIRDVPEGADLHTWSKPITTVVSKMAPGVMFYFLFKTPGPETDGTVVAIRMNPGSWKLLWEETPFSAANVNAFGPIKAPDLKGEDYLVIAADKAGTPLLNTVASCLPKSGSLPARPEAWTPRLAEALQRAGHSWFGLQRVRVEVTASHSSRPDVSPQ